MAFGVSVRKQEDYTIAQRGYVAKWLDQPRTTAPVPVIKALLMLLLAWATAGVFAVHAVKSEYIPLWSYNAARFLSVTYVLFLLLLFVVEIIHFGVGFNATPNANESVTPAHRQPIHHWLTNHILLYHAKPGFFGHVMRFFAKLGSWLLVISLVLDGYIVFSVFVLMLWLVNWMGSQMNKTMAITTIKKLSDEDIQHMDPIISEGNDATISFTQARPLGSS